MGMGCEWTVEWDWAVNGRGAYRDSRIGCGAHEPGRREAVVAGLTVDSEATNSGPTYRMGPV
jgi:hypothetical protein